MSSYDAPNLDELQDAVHDALTSWGKIGSSEEELLGFLLLVQQERASIEGSLDPLKLRKATNRVLEDALEELSRQEETEAEVVKSRFIEGQIIRQVATRLYVSSDQVNRYQRSAIENLSRILLAQEIYARDMRIRELESDLPPSTYTNLFGFKQAAQEITAKLLELEPPWIISVTGLGGIGKTSLADASIRQALRSFQFVRVIWLQARSNPLSGAPLSPEESYSQLLKSVAEQLWPGETQEADAGIAANARELLTQQPHLIVIDNLETEETTNFLVDKVRNWTQPTKILITTRARPTGQASVFYHSIDELSPEDAAALLKHQAELIGLDELSVAKNEEIESIYTVTGGNPLALKLVVSLATVLALPQVLIDIARSRPGPVEELYRHIYWESWRTLGADSQTLLQAMPLVAESGALPEQMRAISKLPEERFWPAVSELISRSLVEIKGTIHERRYGIHRLTETFLRTEIIGWTEQQTS
jgi:hypothetical protein